MEPAKIRLSDFAYCFVYLIIPENSVQHISADQLPIVLKIARMLLLSQGESRFKPRCLNENSNKTSQTECFFYSVFFC